LITTVALALAVCLGLSFPANAAVTNPVAGVASATATGDVISTQLPYGAKVVGVKVNPITGGKYFRLRNGSVVGAVIYETNSAATTSTMVLDNAVFTKPSAGLYFETNDTGSNITIYTEQ